MCQTPTCARRAVLLLLVVGASVAQVLPGARYLILAADGLADAVQPLADWKTAKGMQAQVVPLSVAGSSPAQVRTYIRNACSTWPVKPEYVLLACSPSLLPGYTNDNDCYYGDLSGNYLMEIPVGRLPAQNQTEMRTMVARTLAYELMPDTADTSWLLKGSTLIGEDDTLHPDPYYWPDCRYAHGLWNSAGYTRIDSFDNLRGHSTPDVVAALNDGRQFITFRGVGSGFWWGYWDFFPDTTWQNRDRTPVMVGATCATVTLAPGEEMLGDLAMRFGTPERLGGALAYFGTTRLDLAVSQYRSACYRGFFRSLFAESVPSIGRATVRARWLLDSLYHSQLRYEEWALLGDPEFNLRTRLPRRISVAHDSVITIGSHSLAVSVQSGPSPVQNAVVCLWLDSTAYALDTTDAAGSATLAVSPSHPGLMRVTVTGPNLRPYQGSCAVIATGEPYVVYLRHAVNDSPPGGNGDGCVGPGETITLPLWVRNVGDSVARGVAGVLSTSDSFTVVSDSVRHFGSIAGTDSAFTGPNGFRLAVRAGCPDGHVLPLRLACRDTTGSIWVSAVNSIVVGAPDIEFTDTTFYDSAGNRNGRPDPNETCSAVATLRNLGYGRATAATALLRSFDARFTILDSAGSFGDIPPWSTRTNGADPFCFAALNLIPETPIVCSLYVAARGYSRAFPLTIMVGRLRSTDPLGDGPRPPPLYWAYDDADTAFAEHPSYDWVETRGRGTRLTVGVNNNDTLDLPAEFGPFIFYGRRYDRLTVSAHGWFAPGITTLRTGMNVRLPRNSPPPLAAVNWDALRSDLGGGVWYWHDTEGHRLVIEWDSIAYVNQPGRYDKFQVVIHDTTDACADGNSRFTFQYRTASWYRSSTIGMQDSTGTIGITGRYESLYHRAASPIHAGHAIRFATTPPIPGIFAAFPSAARHQASITLRPNPCRTGTVICFSQPRDPSTRLSFSIFDVSGRIVRHSPFAIRRSPLLLDVSSLSPGLYFVRLSSGTTAATAALTVTR